MKLFDNPVHLLILLLVVIVIFGANKLPGAARSLGRSMRIFKSEVEAMGDDEDKPRARSRIEPKQIEGEESSADPSPTTRPTEATIERAPDDTTH